MTTPNLPSPTLLDLMAVALKHKVDRLSLVRRAVSGPEGGGRVIGVVVVLIGLTAVREVGPYLQRVAASHGLTGDPKDIIDFTPETTMPQLLDHMDKLGRQWGWATFELSDTHNLVTWFIGPKIVTPDFAAQLTRRGIVTKLT